MYFVIFRKEKMNIKMNTASSYLRLQHNKDHEVQSRQILTELYNNYIHFVDF